MWKMYWQGEEEAERQRNRKTGIIALSRASVRFLPFAALVMFIACGGQQGQSGDPSSVAPSPVASATVAQAQEPPPLTYYDTRDVLLSGENPYGNIVALQPGTVGPGTVVHVFGAAYQAGQIDTTLQVGVYMTDVNGNLTHHVWGPVPLQQGVNFETDIIFYPYSDGTVHYKLSGLGSSSTWPNPAKLYSMIDGDGPENLGEPIEVAIEVLGNVQAESRVVSAHLVAKVIQ
jgi:hypothetical protein